MPQPPAKVNGASRNGGGRFASPTADLEELVVEIQSRIDEQLADHVVQSRLLITDRGREAVEDVNFNRVVLALGHSIQHGASADVQADALTRLLAVHRRDEAAEDQLVEALLSLLGVHHANARELRQLVQRNGTAITAGTDVVLDIPAPLLERQQRAVR